MVALPYDQLIGDAVLWTGGLLPKLNSVAYLPCVSYCTQSSLRLVAPCLDRCTRGIPVF